MSETPPYITSESQLCRTCLRSDDLVPIFKYAKLHRKYTAAFYLSTGLQIKLNDNLPQSICSNCLKTIKSALTFRFQSQEAERSLRRLQSKLTPLADIRSEIVKYKRIRRSSRKTEVKIEQVLVETKLENSDGDFFSDFDASNVKTEVDAEENGSCDDINKVEDRSDGAIDDFEWKDDCEADAFQELSVPDAETDRLKRLMEGPLDASGSYRCRLCQKTLKNYACFRAHARLHYASGLLCDICGKSFLRKENLRSHCKAFHGAERTNRCAYCGFGAVDSTQLQVHVRREHTGDRPYVCDTCGASFRSRPQLRHHFDTHTTERNVKCPDCPSTFKSRQQLAVHKHKVHKRRGWRFACYVCGKAYRDPKLVRRHVLKEHGVPRHEQRPAVKYFDGACA